MKAIALISGGLDSILAAKVVKEQGIDIVPVNFRIPFCHRIKKGLVEKSVSSFVRENLGLDLLEIDISEDFLKLLINPRYGFGSNMNPCIDCKIMMLQKAKALMTQLGASFVVTGEVLAQRPMSQHRQALELIEKRSSLEGFLLRPLSAKVLNETIPEKESWVNRSELLNFSGRGRRPQMELAESIGIKDYQNPAGGCLLTDPGFAGRLKDLIGHKTLSIDNIELLKIGRHFRLGPDTKLVVGRNEKENQDLLDMAKADDLLFMPTDNIAGPSALGRGVFNEELIKLSANITCRYCDLNGKIETDIIYRKIMTAPVEDFISLEASVLEESRILSLRI
jgi:tRNA-specific 2-thiouridylase